MLLNTGPGSDLTLAITAALQIGTAIYLFQSLNIYGAILVALVCFPSRYDLAGLAPPVEEISHHPFLIDTFVCLAHILCGCCLRVKHILRASLLAASAG